MWWWLCLIHSKDSVKLECSGNQLWTCVSHLVGSLVYGGISMILIYLCFNQSPSLLLKALVSLNLMFLLCDGSFHCKILLFALIKANFFTIQFKILPEAVPWRPLYIGQLKLIARNILCEDLSLLKISSCFICGCHVKNLYWKMLRNWIRHP